MSGLYDKQMRQVSGVIYDLKNEIKFIKEEMEYSF